MLPKEYRLRSDKDIKTLFCKGKSVFGVYVGVRTRRNTLKMSRFAVVVGTKVSKSAVVRNRVRRQLREMVQSRLSLIRPGFDIAVLVLPRAIGRTFSELEDSLVVSLKKAKLL